MVNLKDPVLDAIVRDLRTFRRGAGEPTVARLTGLFHIVDPLGEGIPERAFEELAALREELGADPETSIGAFFYLSGWGVGMESVDQRRAKYRDTFFVDISTAWRRSERGIRELAAIIRDQHEELRPWAFVSVFQSGNAFQPVLDLNLGDESWRPPRIFINGELIEGDFHPHRNPEIEGRYTRRIVLPETPLDLSVGHGEAMAVVRVEWAMPVWPVWSVLSWTADPRIATHMRTFRRRAVEVQLNWWSRTPAAEAEELATDGGIWAKREAPSG